MHSLVRETSKFTAYVEMVGSLGDFTSKRAAIKSVQECIRASGRAGDHGFVIDSNGELVFEIDC